MQWQILAVCLTTATFLPGATIHFKTRDLETRPDRDDYRGGPLKRRVSSKSHYLLQFKGPITRDQLRELNARGASVTSAVPDNAVMVVANDNFSVEGMGIEWAGRLRATDKLSPKLSDSGPDEPGVFVVEFHSDMDMEAARQMVLEANLGLLEHGDLLSNELLVAGGMDAVSALAEWDEVDYIFPASDDLVAGTPLIACAGALTDQGTVGQYVIVGHGWPRDGAGGVQLTYVFDGLTPRVPAPTTAAEISRALQEWTKYANVHFTAGEDASAPRTIRVTFATGAHGDGYPFQSFGSALAHTFYPAPPNAEPLAGDMHLNEEENWHSGANIDIFTVALHEAGHALGLGHSDKPGAIMYPYYRFGAGISSDDIAGIQALYGAPVDSPRMDAPAANGPPAATPVSPAPNPVPNPVPATPSLLTLAVRNPTAAAIETLGATLPVSGIAANGIGETKIAWQTDRGATGNATGSTAWSIPGVPLSVGLNTVTLTATDAAHRIATTTLAITRNGPAPTQPETGCASNLWM
ncbi:MAG: matrixin family metalloprotease [Bryobacteraceae bacterium]